MLALFLLECLSRARSQQQSFDTAFKSDRQTNDYHILGRQLAQENAGTTEALGLFGKVGL